MPEPTQQQKQAMAMEAHLQMHLDKCENLAAITRWIQLAKATGNDGSSDVRLLQWAAREIIELRDAIHILEPFALQAAQAKTEEP